MQHLQNNQIYHGRAEELIAQVAPESVNLSFWSPPYFVGKEYEKDVTYQQWQDMLRDVIQEHERILVPGGFMVINIADILCFQDETIPRFQAMNISNHKSKVTRDMVVEAKARHPEFTRYQLAEFLGCSEQTIDRRLNGNNIRGGKYNVQTRVKLVGQPLENYAYEVGLYLYDRRVWVKDPAWANSKWVSNSLRAVHEYEDLYIFWKPGETLVDREKLAQYEWREWGSRGVWFIDSVRRNDDHEAKFPLELAERIVRLYSNPGDVVLDPFTGSGTTSIAALKNERAYLGFEKEEKYVELARKNISESLRQAKLPLELD